MAARMCLCMLPGGQWCITVHACHAASCCCKAGISSLTSSQLSMWTCDLSPVSVPTSDVVTLLYRQSSSVLHQQVTVVQQALQEHQQAPGLQILSVHCSAFSVCCSMVAGYTCDCALLPTLLLKCSRSLPYATVLTGSSLVQGH